MAVTKIRKISSTVLLVVAIATVIIFALFLFGGYIDPTAALPEPKFTDLLLYSCYGILLITVLTLVVFAIGAFARNLKDNPKGALGGLAALVALVILLVVTYFIGSTQPMPLSADFQQYNTDFYLRFTDMWLYSIYVVLALCIVALIWGSIRTSLKRGK